ncbi:HesB/IscA family protein [Methylacidiphilum caldifontis]|uniref:Fe-S cluster assembly scaffold protein SufA n=1 Tax=Methylacidiphilum caldifontis TaxID=2795386 RepID=A0A4Y8P9A3_9BACT|nr:iron-sulfur cluster biosynthesis family protein [Methylacidiphilum caldifontis]QSR89481.1 Fe-S cluster assembly scaffold protein SufA [Methylacidiphilum caldifontis]TFE67268.1 Fe-S cluster assembly scaffold protein SufA [Methylacidiphilum caldifontis]
MKIAITPKAKSFINRMIRMCGGSTNAGMRLIVGEGGCSGLTTEFSVEEKPWENDLVWEEGVKLFIPQQSASYFEDAIVHFVESPTETRLIVLSARKTQNSCSCSSSTSESSA